uniref:Putative lipocalin 36 n=1 Tax=Rhipicephalus microplus TaxID=6941 RepID=A0A6G5A0E3_RHIMP
MAFPAIAAFFLSAFLFSPAFGQEYEASSNETKVEHYPIDEASSNETKVEDYPIDQFMNTTQGIWVLNTTQRNPQSCKKDTNVNMTANETYFYRSYEENDTIVNVSLVGEFGHFADDEDVRNLITITGGQTDVVAEVLLYRSQNNSCGVVLVTASISDDKCNR